MMNLKAIGIVTLAVAAAGCFAPQVQAQQQPDNIGDVMSRAMFARSGDIYRNDGIDRQFTVLFGLSFPEKEDFGDAQSIERIYRDGMRQQATSVIRTQDLPNPFDSSIGLMR